LAKQVKIPKTNTWVEFYLFDCAGHTIFNQRNLNSRHVSPHTHQHMSCAFEAAQCCNLKAQTREDSSAHPTDDRVSLSVCLSVMVSGRMLLMWQWCMMWGVENHSSHVANGYKVREGIFLLP